MDTKNPVPSFPELVRIADCLLEESGEDEDALVRRMEVLPGPVRCELLVSDLLNAWQVFYYFFRFIPDELVKERLELEPASSLVNGVAIDEIELLTRVFRVNHSQPVDYRDRREGPAENIFRCKCNGRQQFLFRIDVIAGPRQ